MVFSKSFPRNIKGSPYPVWDEISLTDEEEKEQEEHCRKKNIEIMKECIEDAKQIIIDLEGLKDYQSDRVNMAISLFEKRASHEIYWKEDKSKEKFDKLK
jgi:hypothetical protein